MWWDSYPYSTVSVHALHPQHLALRALLPSTFPPSPPPQQQQGGSGGGSSGLSGSATVPPEVWERIEDAKRRLDLPQVRKYIMFIPLYPADMYMRVRRKTQSTSS